VSDPEFEAALWRETDHSLREDPERWVFQASGSQSFSNCARGEDDDGLGHRRSERALAHWERRRTREAAAEES
jgi:hypothetical protein